MGNLYNDTHLKRTKTGDATESGSEQLKNDLTEEIEDIQKLQEEIDTMNLEQQPKSEMHDEIIDLQEELREAQHKLLYAAAEMENVRNRAKQDIEKTHKYGLEKFINELIPVIDSLELALGNIIPNEQEHPICSGVKLTRNMLVTTIEKFGIKQIDPLHEPFDPRFHEAMSTQENPEVDRDTVLIVLQKGYLLYDRLVRPALVIVSK